MTESAESDSSVDSSQRNGRYLVYFAAERTLMAWIRAALGLMALGFVIDRFGLVVRTLSMQSGDTHYAPTFSFLAGAGMVAAGTVMAVVAAVRYGHFAWRFRQSGDTDPGYGLGPAIFFTALVSLGGAAIAGYLILVA